MASRITRKSTAPKLNRFQITTEALPGTMARGSTIVTSYGMPTA